MAEYNISDIRAGGDPQRAYEFEVKIVAAPTAIGWVARDQDILVQRVQNVTIPEVSVEPIEVPFRSSTSVWPGRDSSPHTATVTFYQGQSEDTRGLFLGWSNLIRNPYNGNAEVSSRTAYAGVVAIRKYATNGDQTSLTALVPAWPSSVGELSLGYESNEAATFDVTFSYDEQVSSGQLALFGIDI